MNRVRVGMAFKPKVRMWLYLNTKGNVWKYFHNVNDSSIQLVIIKEILPSHISPLPQRVTDQVRGCAREWACPKL